MTARDARGRFVTEEAADIAAAERGLTAAVRRAVEIIRDGGVEIVRAHGGTPVRALSLHDRRRVLDTLTAAGITADLLLTQPAKARKETS